MKEKKEVKERKEREEREREGENKKDARWLHGYQTAASDRYGLLKEFANENKRHQTLAERLLWEELRQNPYNLKFRRQHIIGDYIADFVCLDYKLIVEVDGGYHSQYKQQEKDSFRSRILADMGFTVVRYYNSHILAVPSIVAEDIYNLIFAFSENMDL